MNTVDITAWILGLVVTAIIVGCVRMSAVMDIPNDRSMHKIPTPRGGGLGIVIGFVVGCAVLFARPKSDLFSVIAGMLIGGLPIAAIGWLDDRTNVSPKWRALVHVSASAAALGVLVLTTQNVTGLTTHPPFIPFWAWWILGSVACAYFLNIYNFMDGLDGLAGSEGAFAGFAGALIVAHRAYSHVINRDALSQSYIRLPEQPTPICILIGLCCVGFLFWNWPPAKIFMGDIGSGFLGFIFGFLALYGTLRDPASIAMWLIIFGVFVVDGTTTLITRAATNQKWYEAHNLHAFQKAARHLKNHSCITLGILSIDIFWLFPLALYADSHRELAFLMVPVAYAPLLAIALLFKAGRHECSNQQVAV
jgi:Fuc2NAc and GlcNAc transferase